MSVLFTKRHYEWLACFARAELPVGDRIALRNALSRQACENDGKFDAAKFDIASGAAEWLAGLAALVRSSSVE